MSWSFAYLVQFFDLYMREKKDRIKSNKIKNLMFDFLHIYMYIQDDILNLPNLYWRNARLGALQGVEWFSHFPNYLSQTIDQAQQLHNTFMNV